VHPAAAAATANVDDYDQDTAWANNDAVKCVFIICRRRSTTRETLSSTRYSISEQLKIDFK